MKKKYCRHYWNQIGKRFEVDKEGFVEKILIDQCEKCGKKRER